MEQGTNLKYILSTIHKRDANVVGVLTDNPKAGGIDIAKSFAVPVEIVPKDNFSSREEFDREVVKRIVSYSPDLTVLAGFMRILTPIFTSQIKAINLHPSLLPRHKGLNAIERSFKDNFKYGGVSVHWVNDELDGGEIILQKSILKDGLDFQSYYNAIRKMEKDSLVEAILMVLNLKLFSSKSLKFITT